MDHENSKQLLQRIRLGDEQAAAELMDHYADRLVALARTRLSKKLARRLDPEDVVQSACRSFFRNTRAGHYDVRDSDDLWRLLAAITVHKALRQVKRHLAAKRDPGKEDSTGRGAILQVLSPQAFSRDPNPDDAAIMVEEMEVMMAALSPLHRQIIEFSLRGFDVVTTAQAVRRSERTVQRALEQARDLLEHRLYSDLDSDR